MKFSYNWLQEYFKEKLPKPEKLAELLTMRSFEVERVERISKDWIFNIDILPNRMPDASGHLGIARECAAILNLKLKAKSKKPQLSAEGGSASGGKTKNSKDKFLEIKVEDSNLCPRYTARVVQNVKVGSSPKWLKERLELLGLNSINNVVDAANYIMLETGQPTHVFDADKINNSKLKTQNSKLQLKAQNFRKQIIIRMAKNGEKITTLDNKEYELNDSVLVIADSKDPLAIAGIKGGKKAEVDSKTKNIVLESANFDASNIRITSQNLNLRTDASVRFSYGIDPNLAEEAGGRLAMLIQELAGGETTEGIIDAYPKKIVPAKILLDFNKIRKVAGADIADEEIKNILQKFGFKLLVTRYSLLVTIPTARRDLQIKEDLIEEIARVYGYENIKPRHPFGELVPPQKNDYIFWSAKARDALKELGFFETYNYSFVGQKEADAMPDRARTNLIEVKNPIRPEFKFMKPALIHNLLNNAAMNLKNYNSVELFEIGKIFKFAEKKFTDTPQLEETRLAFVAAENSKDIFLKLKGALTSLFESLGIGGIWFDDAPDSPSEFQDVLRVLTSFSRSAQIKIGDDILGVIGELHPETRKRFGIESEAGFVELNFDETMKIAKEEQEFRPISKYPAIFRDISVLVPYQTKITEVMDIIENVAGALLADTDLFDVYEDEALAGGKKSIAFRLMFQSHEKTLSDEEVNKIMNRVIKTLEEKPDWEVRK